MNIISVYLIINDLIELVKVQGDPLYQAPSAKVFLFLFLVSNLRN